GHLLCQARGQQTLRIALVYFNVATEEETVLSEIRDAAWLKDYFETQCGLFQAWAAAELAHRQARDDALAALGFPPGKFRPGQRELAVATYRTVRAGGCLLAQASTGIGKTLATVFPALRAMPEGCVDKIFFLAAKNAGKRLALEALDALQAPQPHPV